MYTVQYTIVKHFLSKNKATAVGPPTKYQFRDLSCENIPNG